MPGDRCTQNTRTGVSPCIDGFPQSQPKRERWINALELTEGDLKDYHRVCSRHFPDGDATKNPQLNLGKRFASPNLILLEYLDTVLEPPTQRCDMCVERFVQSSSRDVQLCQFDLILGIHG